MTAMRPLGRYGTDVCLRPAYSYTQSSCWFIENSIKIYYIAASITLDMLYMPAGLPARNLAACTAPLPNTALE